MCSSDFKKYKKYLKRKQAKVVEAVGVSQSNMVHGYYSAISGFSAIMSQEEAAKMREHEDVADVVEDEKVMLDYIPDDNSSNSPRRLTDSTPAGGVVNGIPNSRHLTESSPEFLGLTGPAEPWARGIKGEDVVIGILDSGIWSEHPSFADDGSYDTLDDYTDLPCTFGNTEHNPMDDPFDCNNKLLGARNVLDTYRALVGFEEDEFDSARDSSGHGTHTASTAGGNEGVPAELILQSRMELM